jgi:hypothetical protein
LQSSTPKEQPPGSVQPPSIVHASWSSQDGGVPGRQIGGSPIGTKQCSTPLQARPSLGQSGSCSLQPTPATQWSTVHGSESSHWV